MKCTVRNNFPVTEKDRPGTFSIHRIHQGQPLRIKKIFFAWMACVFLCIAGCFIMPSASAASSDERFVPCWTNLHAETEFPDDDPFQLGDRVLLLRRGTYAFDLYYPAEAGVPSSRRYPLAVIAAPLKAADQQVLADLFCSRGWLMLALELPPAPSEERILGALICAHRYISKFGRILPGTQLLTGYGTGAEVGVFFAATRRPFVAWIGDTGMASCQTESGSSWLAAALNAHPDLLLYVLQQGTNQLLSEAVVEVLPENATYVEAAIPENDVPLPADAVGVALDWVRHQLLFVLPPDGRHFEYAQMEYDRLQAELSQVDETERAGMLQEMRALAERFSLNVQNPK